MPHSPVIAPPPDADGVELFSNRVGFQGFFRISVLGLRFRRFDGAWSASITREIFERGAAAAVLPYDPVRDEVILIRQFLPGAYAAGRACFPPQIIAGMIGLDETPREVAEREAREEADCAVRDVVHAATFMPSPGGSSEAVHVFVARADASAAGGIHGLAEEGENIRVEVLKAEDAIARLDAGEIESGPAVVALLWFARHRDRLRREWAAA